ncbi:phage antirepressor KilAC domain-containing protein [Acinetobacter variabilis]|uniref:phage antirepressor KilAC domain-containing protein n=1 Tax=Acinetobacter variabilis TaxID=70346 RepID=UPI00254DC82E|nr:phage antirepressor KilAC domain-containing protein [Acinetobacter variabilis]WKT72003.1 phage antirepressor KilAC domain-containing protein [Acinetobacter variabilis]
MNMMTQFNHNQNTMSNIELLEVINQARKEFNEKPVRLNDFNNRIADELEGEYYETFVVRNPNGTTSQGFNLNIDQCTLIGMRESKGVRKNVLAILKEKQKPFDITNPAHLLQAIEIQAKLNIELSEKVAVLAPKAEALETIADTSNTYCLRECAKTIGIKESELIQLLINKKWIYRDSDRKLQPHAQYVLNKVFTNRTSPVIVNRNDGKERVFLHMRVTAFGLTRITGLVNKVRNTKQVAA